MIQDLFQLTRQDKREFSQKGFVKLRNFLKPDVIERFAWTLDRKLENGRNLDWYGNVFNRIKYDFANNDRDVLALMQDPIFSQTLTELARCSLLYTQSVGFELKKDQDIGLSWHVGTISFAFQPMEDFGCSLWIPTVNIDGRGQGGGISCVPKDIFSGQCMFQYNELLSSYARRLKERGTPIPYDEFSELELRPISSPEVSAMLDEQASTPDFEVGDAMLFDKNVLHRSVPLGQGPLEARGALTLRFVDASSGYDLERARNQLPMQEGLNYDQQTIYCLEICKQDQAPLIDSPLFDGTREQRVLRRHGDG